MPRGKSPETAVLKRRGKRTTTPELSAFDFQHDSLGYKLRLAQVRAYEMFYQTLTPLDLSPARVTALSLIAMNPGINQSALAKALDVAGPSVLKVVDTLEQSGWVQRVDVEGDRRRYSLEITAQGHEYLEQLREKLTLYEKKLSQNLTAIERRQLIDMLERIAT
ncbi:Transcriptional repressor MprA [compost metagenome]|jgi:DNA-binding MarR family transcriptional regulator